MGARGVADESQMNHGLRHGPTLRRDCSRIPTRLGLARLTKSPRAASRRQSSPGGRLELACRSECGKGLGRQPHSVQRHGLAAGYVDAPERRRRLPPSRRWGGHGAPSSFGRSPAISNLRNLGSRSWLVASRPSLANAADLTHRSSDRPEAVVGRSRADERPRRLDHP